MKMGTASPFETNKLGFYTSYKTVEKEQDLADVDCLVLWGGTDIGTGIYNEKPNKFCLTEKLSTRDRIELRLIHAAIKRDLPILGICRGAQLLCCVAGGKLLQHIENHGQDHNIKLLDEDGSVMRATSSHHQMMLPPQNAKILAVATEPTIGVNQHNGCVNVPEVPEVVFFPNIKALGIQPHPEWASPETPFNQYVIRKIKEYLHANTKMGS